LKNVEIVIVEGRRLLGTWKRFYYWLDLLDHPVFEERMGRRNDRERKTFRLELHNGKMFEINEC